jgi:hypothetical protein
MGLTLPASLTIQRDADQESTLVQKAREWVTKDERSPGVHASELLDPRKAYWQRKDPKPLTDRLVNTFLVGKVLHAFVINAVEGTHLDWKTDEGSRTSEELGIEYSPDLLNEGVVREIKTSRSFFEPKTFEDLGMYCEQLLTYLAATDTLTGFLYVLYLNLRDEEGRTAPAFRCYRVSVSQADLDKLKKDIITVRHMLLRSIDANLPGALPLCREWLCSAKMCDWWEKCQPETRYGNPDYGKKKKK